MATLTIPARFNGPDGSANGGVACGLLAQHVDAPVVTGRLLAPPPLDTEMAVVATDHGVEAHLGDQTVAKAWASELDMPVLPAPPRAELDGLDVPDSWFTDHPYPRCFTCGPDRPGDGLEIYPRRLAETAVRFASGWVPPSDLAGPDGALRQEAVWAALDCPSCFPFLSDMGRAPVILGELTAEILGPVIAGEEHVVLSWPLGEDGRKKYGAAAIFAGPRLVARSKATWIELKQS